MSIKHKVKVMIRAALLGLSMSCVFACSMLAARYEQPENSKLTQHYSQVALEQKGEQQESSKLLAWDAFIVDEQLKSFVKLGLENNRDLHIAALNVEKAREFYRIERSNYLPDIGITGSGQHTGTSLNVPAGEATTHLYQANVGIAAYELDFFGRIHNLSEAALQRYLATEAGQASAHIALVAEISNIYIQYQVALAELALLENNLEFSKELLRVSKRRLDMGVENPILAEQSKLAFEADQVLLLQQKQHTNALKLALQTLLVEPVNIEVSDINQALFVSAVPEGLSSELLMSRPDIRQAEANLRAANADIGVARANFFPRISLTANAGVASESLSNLFESDSEAWLFKPEIYIPLFRGGANKSVLKQAKLNQEIAVTQYEKSIEQAFREVIDALQSNTALQQQADSSEKQIQSSQLIQRLAESRFERGIDSPITLLNTQKNQISLQRNALQVKQQYALGRVNLYKALGGGWH